MDYLDEVVGRAAEHIAKRCKKELIAFCNENEVGYDIDKFVSIVDLNAFDSIDALVEDEIWYEASLDEDAYDIISTYGWTKGDWDMLMKYNDGEDVPVQSGWKNLSQVARAVLMYEYKERDCEISLKEGVFLYMISV